MPQVVGPELNTGAVLLQSNVKASRHLPTKQPNMCDSDVEVQ